MPRGTWGLSAVESKRLERAPRFFRGGFKGCVWGKKLRAHRIVRRFGASLNDPYGVTEHVPLFVKVCLTAPANRKTLPTMPVTPSRLTESPQPIYSDSDSGGRPERWFWAGKQGTPV